MSQSARLRNGAYQETTPTQRMAARCSVSHAGNGKQITREGVRG